MQTRAIPFPRCAVAGVAGWHWLAAAAVVVAAAAVVVAVVVAVAVAVAVAAAAVVAVVVAAAAAEPAEVVGTVGSRFPLLLAAPHHFLCSVGVVGLRPPVPAVFDDSVLRIP